MAPTLNPPPGAGEGHRFRWRLQPIALLAAGLGLVALLLPWLEVKSSRIAGGTFQGVWGWGSVWPFGLGLLWLLVAITKGRLQGLLLGFSVLAWGLLAGQAAAHFLQGQPESARASLAVGFWLSLLAFYVGFFAAYRQGGPVSLVSLPVALAVLIVLGAFNQLGPIVELASWRDQFVAELWRHLALALTAVILSVVVGLPLGVLATRGAAFAWVLPVTGFLQTIPSLALFGLLLPVLATLSQGVRLEVALAVLGVGLLATRLLWAALGGLALLVALPLGLLALILGGVWLYGLLGPDGLHIALNAPLAESGVRGIGAAPALLALTLYALLPVVLNVYTGLRGVPEAAKDAGRGMGMSPPQLFWRVEFPLALPLILEGLRGAASLTIGITTVAALIGAGGLGFFVLRGVESGANDMVLLGAIPVIGLALVVDTGLRLAGLGLRRRLGIV